ncbi:MAG: high frequency lysogenization protein HflD [Shewanellaceae bacterium]|nr:high frequency lysogenization protein HflD [Shewanellaceae bacterium]
MHNFQESTMAFAGICQSIHLLHDIAIKGHADNALIEQSLQSILITDPEHIHDILGHASHLNIGYRTIIEQLDQKHQNPNTMRYVLGVLMLERKLAKQPQTMKNLAHRLQDIERQRQHFQLTDPQILANLASIYSDIISPLGPKIMINGRPEHINNTHNQYKIRALLLATVRAAVLWRQLGGKRRHLIFNRRNIVQQAQRYL